MAMHKCVYNVSWQKKLISFAEVSEVLLTLTEQCDIGKGLCVE